MNITEKLDSIGPGTIIQYLAREGEGWWAELRLPDEGYRVPGVTSGGASADEALQNTIDRALKFAKNGGDE